MAAVALNSGCSMPAIAFGFWQIAGEHCAEALEAAIDAGYRCLDCASIYGNEVQIGEALTKVLASGKVKREELFIVSKLWATDWHQVDAACSKTLKDLQLEYLDLYLVHSAVGVDTSSGQKKLAKIPCHTLWSDMESLAQSGKAKSIGVSNWSCLQVADALNYAKIPPAVNQLEIHPTYSNADLAQWCLSQGVAVMGYCTLGSGKPDMQLGAAEAPAKRLGVLAAQVLVKWSMQKGYVPVTKSVNKERMKSNLSLDFSLTNEEMQALDACDGGLVMKICNHAGEFGLPLYS